MPENEELVQLLSSLPEAEPDPDQEDDGTTPAAPPAAEPAPIQAPAPPEPTLVPPDPPPAPPQSDLLAETPATDDLGVKQLLSKFGGSVDEIICNQRQDRIQVSQAIQVVAQHIAEKIQNEPNNLKGIGVFLDAWARMLQTKADINANASRALDSIAKLLSAGKSNDLILNITGKNLDTNNLDLEALLNQPPTEDELNADTN
jgi:hypothetical protein